MTSPTHIAFSGFLWLFISSLMGLPLNILWMSICCVSSLLPDVDCSNSWVGRILFFVSGRVERRFGHRTITHSLLGILAMGVVFFPFLFISPTLFSAGLVGYMSHVFLDCINKTGVSLFYPDGIQAVIPGREEYRFVYGGKGERIILFLFIGLGVLMYPIADKGLIKAIHYVRGDPEAAVSDFRDYAQGYMVWCNLKGIDSLTNKPVDGRFKVVGASGSTTLIISNEGHLRTVGASEGVNIRAIRARCVKGEAINVVVNEIDLKERYLEDIREYVDLSREHYLFGILDVEERPSVPEKIERFKTIGYLNNKLVLEYANWLEIEELGIKDVFVKEGHVIIKTILKRGESLNAGWVLTRKEKEEGEPIRIILFVETPKDILVKEGDSIHAGSPITCMGEGMQGELNRLKKELVYQDYLINKGIGSRKERDSVLRKIRDVEEEYKNERVSKFNGKVTKVKVKDVRNGKVKVEVVLEVEKG